MEFTLEQVDNGIYEAIRKKIVSAGYLPDILLYLPETPITKTAYEAAKAAIRTSGKDIIEVFGVGDSESRDEILEHKIIINRLMPLRSNVGFFGAQDYIPQGDPELPATIYKKYSLPRDTYMVEYNITYVTKSTRYDYILDGIIRAALNGTSLKGYNDAGVITTKAFDILYINGVNTSDEKFIEKTYRYNVGPLMLDQATFIEDVVQLQEAVDIEPWPTKEITGDVLDPNLEPPL